MTSLRKDQGTGADDEEEAVGLLSGNKEVLPASDTQNPETTGLSRYFSKKTLMFLFCFFGLQASYLTWGFMQELVMTTTFKPTKLTPDGLFPSSSFCVFSNRIVAMLVAWFVCVQWKGGIKGAAPMWAYLPCSISNTISSWSQYACLKYVSLIEYLEACMITTGVLLFSAQQGSEHVHDSTNFYGIILLCGYITADSFTSQYQSSIYKSHGKVDQYHMMFGINMWSMLISLASMVVAGEIPVIIEFMQENPSSLLYNAISAICGTTGQFFIYTTIKEFGPVVFTIIMTTRQMLSMVFSTMYFGHPMASTSYIAVILVFGTVFYSVKRQREASLLKAEGDKAKLAVPGIQMASIDTTSRDLTADSEKK